MSGVKTSKAPAPVGPYPHAKRVGDFIFVSGMGPRQPGTNAIPGGPIKDEQGQPRDYDVAAQTAATIENIRVVLEAAGAALENVVDVTCFLVDMERDFADFNRVYGEFFAEIGPTRTTMEINCLPTPIAVELKAIAWVGP
jgi:2-aminomuconate deaminase